MNFLQRNLNIIKFKVLRMTDCLLLCLVEGSFHEFTSLSYTKDVSFNKIEHEYICCEANLVINDRF